MTRHAFWIVGAMLAIGLSGIPAHAQSSVAIVNLDVTASGVGVIMANPYELRGWRFNATEDIMIKELGLLDVTNDFVAPDGDGFLVPHLVGIWGASGEADGKLLAYSIIDDPEMTNPANDLFVYDSAIMAQYDWDNDTIPDDANRLSARTSVDGAIWLPGSATASYVVGATYKHQATFDLIYSGFTSATAGQGINTAVSTSGDVWSSPWNGVPTYLADPFSVDPSIGAGGGTPVPAFFGPNFIYQVDSGVEPTGVPEPASLVLGGLASLGMVALAIRRRRRRRRAR